MADGQPFVIWVEFDVKPEAIERFHAAALDDSTCSVRDEEGCLQFDVLTPTKGGNTFALYEVYKSKEAFAAHMAMPHFKRFGDVADATVTDKRVSELFRVQGAAK